MTTLRLKGIPVQCRIGVPEEERAHPQPLVIDLEFRDVETRAGGYLDYQKASETVASVCRDRAYTLVEELADVLASALLSEFRSLPSVLVRVHKKPAAMPGILVEAELEKTR